MFDDLPSQFFFRKMWHQQKHNHIYMLSDTDGQWVAEQQDITQLIASITHILSVYLVPKTIFNKLDAMLGHFYWANNNSQGITWRKKEVIQLLKSIDRLGIHNICLFTRDLRMKKKFVCTRLPLPLSSSDNPSRGMWGLLTAMAITTEYYVWKIEDVTNISAINHRWVNGTTPLLRDSITLHIVNRLKVTDLIRPCCS